MEQHAVNIIPQLWLTVMILTVSEENVTLEASAVFRLCSSILGNTIFSPLITHAASHPLLYIPLFYWNAGVCLLGATSSEDY